MENETQNYQERLLKDKKVDEVFESKGLNNVDIYYSPRQVYLDTMARGMIYGGVAGIFILAQLVWNYKILIYPTLIYIFLIYIANHYLNNSFGISNQEVFAVNTSFIFKNFTSFKINDIKLIKRKVHKINWMHFLLLPSSHIEIHTQTDIHKFYCIWLEDDYFDENSVWKTMDWFESSLKKINIKTEFWYPYEN